MPLLHPYPPPNRKYLPHCKRATKNGFVRVFLLLIVLLFSITTSFAQTVELDTNFGNDGYVITNGTTGIDKTIFTVDGKLLSMGNPILTTFLFYLQIPLSWLFA